jgi:phenylpropionate dioxygenase-like ring-hydroxylating dioxygenase large terminal subunit
MNASEMRDRIPAEGLREYWYPALPARQVGKKPRGLRIMATELVLFRDRAGEVVALEDACPHRGGSLSRGDCHYAGTVACPYHGWVFDGDGECVAVLSEGPDSRIPGKVTARKYPTRTLKGLVFIWMGDGEPAAIEDDVPPEFFDGDDTRILVTVREWPINWRVALENALDSHVMYVHRDSVLQLKEPVTHFGARGYRPRVVNGRAVIGHLIETPVTEPAYFPALGGTWPKRQRRNLWLWLFRWRAERWRKFPPFNDCEEWDMHTFLDGERVRSGGHHLPTMFRFDYGSHMYTRACVPIDEDRTRVVYYHSIRVGGPWNRLWRTAYFRGFHLWAMNSNFSTQDLRVMEPQRFDLPERLSGTDAEIVVWRRLLLTARGMPPGLVPVEGDDAQDVA